MVETALATLLVLIFMAGTMELAYLQYRRLVLQYATVMGARDGVVLATQGVEIRAGVRASVIARAARFGVPVEPSLVFVCPLTVPPPTCLVLPAIPEGPFVVRATVVQGYVERFLNITHSATGLGLYADPVKVLQLPP